MIELWECEVPGYDKNLSDELPSLVPYVINNNKTNGAIIICPGGGYHHRAEHEGEPIALWLNSIGISAFVLNYRIAPYKDPIPLLDAQRAIRFVRYHADKWKIDKDKIGIMGFSAGGHLASSVGTHFDYGIKSAIDPVDNISCRPDAMILCYPVISFFEYRHNGSMVNLLGDFPNEARRAYLSNENSVSENTPKTFLWHTAEDQSVPVENSLLFAGALSKYRIPFQLHIFPNGRHGLGLAKEVEDVHKWTELCEVWLRKISFI